MRRGFEGKSGTGGLGVGDRGRRGDTGPLGGGTARQGDQQHRRTHRAGTPAGLDRPGGAARGPDGLAVRHEGRHHLAAGLEAQRLEDVRREAGGQPGARRPHRRTARRPLGRLPLCARPPGRRRPAQRLRRPRRQPGGRRPAAGGQRAGLPGAARLAGHPEGEDRENRPLRRGQVPRRSGGSASRTLKAKFPGRCVCGRPYAAGEQIAKNAQGWGHPECRTADADAG